MDSEKTYHRPKDLTAFILTEKLLKTVNRKSIELRRVLHLTGENRRKAFESAKHGATDIDPGVDVLVDPAWPTISWSLHPMKEVEKDLRAHAVGYENHFLV